MSSASCVLLLADADIARGVSFCWALFLHDAGRLSDLVLITVERALSDRLMTKVVDVFASSSSRRHVLELQANVGLLLYDSMTALNNVFSP